MGRADGRARGRRRLRAPDLGRASASGSATWPCCRARASRPGGTSPAASRRTARPPRRARARGGRDLAGCARPVTAPTLRGGIRPLLFPGSVAVVGASDRTPEAPPPTSSRCCAAACRPGSSTRTGPTVLGRECFPSLDGAAGAPECASCSSATRASRRPSRTSLAAGVRAVVLPGLGAEAGAEGRAVAARIAARAAEFDAAVVGPELHGRRDAGRPLALARHGAGPSVRARGTSPCVAQSGSIARGALACGPRVGLPRRSSRAAASSARDARRLRRLPRRRRGHDGGRRCSSRRCAGPPAFADALALARRGRQAGRLPQGRALAGRGAGGARALGRARRLRPRLLGPAARITARSRSTTSTTSSRRSRCSAGGGGRAGSRVAAVSESGGECALLADHGGGGRHARSRRSPDALARRSSPRSRTSLLPENPLDCWAIDGRADRLPRAPRAAAPPRATTTCCSRRSICRSFAATARRSGATLIVRVARASRRRGTDALPGRDLGPRVRPAAGDRGAGARAATSRCCAARPGACAPSPRSRAGARGRPCADAGADADRPPATLAVPAGAAARARVRARAGALRRPLPRPRGARVAPTRLRRRARARGSRSSSRWTGRRTRAAAGGVVLGIASAEAAARGRRAHGRAGAGRAPGPARASRCSAA